MSTERRAHLSVAKPGEPVPTGGGRPPYSPTQEDKEIMISMTFAGFTHERIAKAMKLAENTLRKHFPDELQCGADRMLADVVRSLAAKARAGDTTACIWITKTRLNWREQPQQVEMSGREGRPIEVAEKEALVERVLKLVEQGRTRAM